MNISDEDKTLYVQIWAKAVDTQMHFNEMSVRSRQHDFREVHRAEGDSEHPFALLQTRSVRNALGHLSREDVLRTLDPAFHVFNSTRKRTLVLLPSVRTTLEALEAEGIVLVAPTESKLYAVVDRLDRLDLFRYFKRVYCREPSPTPHPMGAARTESRLEKLPTENIVELSKHQRKPDESVLLEIFSREGFAASETAYVGDSLARDILMAKRAGALSIWAEYGSKHVQGQYSRLVRISHWSDADIAREIALRREAEKIRPDYVARETFSEVLTAIGVR